MSEVQKRKKSKTYLADSEFSDQEETKKVSNKKGIINKLLKKNQVL